MPRTADPGAQSSGACADPRSHGRAARRPAAHRRPPGRVRERRGRRRPVTEAARDGARHGGPARRPPTPPDTGEAPGETTETPADTAAPGTEPSSDGPPATLGAWELREEPTWEVVVQVDVTWPVPVPKDQLAITDIDQAAACRELAAAGAFPGVSGETAGDRRDEGGRHPHPRLHVPHDAAAAVRPDGLRRCPARRPRRCRGRGTRRHALRHVRDDRGAGLRQPGQGPARARGRRHPPVDRLRRRGEGGGAARRGGPAAAPSPSTTTSPTGARARSPMRRR